MTTEQFKIELVKKVEFQWKTLQSAFKQLNLSRSGKIQYWELKYFCDHWGFLATDEQFKEIFDTFDIDKDGEISYQDMQKAFGSVLNPRENFYFRQDLKKKALSNTCSVKDCGFNPVGFTTMCLMHSKQMRMKAMNVLAKLREKLSSDWDLFIENLKEEATNQLDSARATNDGVSIEFIYFIQMLREGYSIRLSDVE